jgi:hypothetical protein
MTQTTMSSNGNGNGHTTSAAAEPIVAQERRQTVSSPSVSPDTLVARHVENARRQLAEARERLKAARRRVVQLEDALGNWERFAAEVRNAHDPGAPQA